MALVGSTKTLATCTLVLLLGAGCSLGDPPPSPRPPVIPPYTPHADIRAAIGGVSPGNLRRLVDRLASFHTRHSLSDVAPGGNGIGAARAWIESELRSYAAASGSRLQVTLDPFVAPAGKRVPAPTGMVNILATLPGTLRDRRTYIVGAHYDSRATDPMDSATRAPGANDDGSGTAAVMELARVLSAHEQAFEATLVFALFAGEEQGLLGSRHLARRAVEEGWNVAGMMALDIVGRSGGIGPPTVRVFSEGLPVSADEETRVLLMKVGAEADSPARQLARFVRATATLHVPVLHIAGIWRADRYARGGDHKPFSEAGIAAIRWTEPNEDYTQQHQDVRVENGVAYGDLPEHVEADYLALVTRAVGASLSTLAVAPPAPEAVLDARALEAHTTLYWKPSAGPDVVGYEVLLRPTDAPDWRSAIDVGAVTGVTVHASKDDFIFALRAVDRDGHRSPAAFPLPLLKKKK